MRHLLAILDPVTLLKILADVITAGSGILGLLTNFKKKMKAKGKASPKGEIEVISTPGKIALIGIVLGFGVSTTITILDARAGKLNEKQHQHEFAVLSQPVSKQMLVTIWYESLSSDDNPKSPKELPEIGSIAFVKGNKPCSRATIESGDLTFAPEVVVNRDFGGTPGPEFLMMSPNHHNRSYIEESRRFDIQYRAKNALLGSDELAGSTLIVVFYEEKGATQFEFRAIELPIVTGSTLQFTADEFKHTTGQHQTIVDESAKMFGEKGEEPKTIVEHYYCYALPSQ